MSPDARFAFGPRVAVHGPLGRAIRGLDQAVAFAWGNPLAYGVLVLASLYAGYWGFTAFYGLQFLASPVWAWPFIPDSPGATSLWLLASIAVKLGWDARPSAFGQGWNLLTHLAIVLNTKVGIWTVFVLLFHYEHYFGGAAAQTALQWVLVGTHLGMVGLALTLFRKAWNLGVLGFLAITAIVFAGDFMDYLFVPWLAPASGWSFYPAGVPSTPATLRVVQVVTLALSAASIAALAVGLRLRGPPMDRGVPRDDA